MHHQTAKQIASDHRAYLNDKSGTAWCPNLHQVLVAETFLAGEDPTGLPGAPFDDVMPYTRPGETPPTEAEARNAIIAMIAAQAEPTPPEGNIDALSSESAPKGKKGRR